MKREFKAVAMRFTKEEFEGMDKSGMEILDVFGFESQPYLVNNYSGIELRVTNFEKQTAKCRDRKTIETCDPKLFRQYCGLENSVEELSDFEKGLETFFSCFSKNENQKSRVEEELNTKEKINQSYDICDAMIKELEKNQETFQAKEIQFLCKTSNKWVAVKAFAPDAKFRFKPNPTKTLDTEIEALNQKAKEMGFKAVITFESL